MAHFIIRVELHNSVQKDYELLHSSMEKSGFKRTITSGDNIEYHLPTAEYNIMREVDLLSITQLVESIVITVGKEFSVLVSEIKVARWVNLKSVKK